jgi:hypothetical protein
MDIKEVTDRNRDGDIIRVKRISLNEFIMSGYSPSFYRTSRTDDNRVIMFDPSGGPYTTAKHGEQPGTDMGYYHDEWKNLIVESIEFLEDGVKLTCTYDKKITWEQINI